MVGALGWWWATNTALTGMGARSRRAKPKSGCQLSLDAGLGLTVAVLTVAAATSLLSNVLPVYVPLRTRHRRSMSSTPVALNTQRSAAAPEVPSSSYSIARGQCSGLLRVADRHPCSRDAPTGSRWFNRSALDAAMRAQTESIAAANFTCPVCYGSGCAFRHRLAERLGVFASASAIRATPRASSGRTLQRLIKSGAGVALFRVDANRSVQHLFSANCSSPWRASRVWNFRFMLQDTVALYPIPEVELIFCCGDYMASWMHSVMATRHSSATDDDAHGPLPVFTTGPTCAFSSNVPVPSFDGSRGLHWRSFDQEAEQYKSLQKQVDWASKESTLLWRGTLRSTMHDFGCPSISSRYGRARLIRTLCEYMSTGVESNRGKLTGSLPRQAAPPFNVLAINLPNGSRMDLNKSERFKFHLCVEGEGLYADRLPRMFFSGSVLFYQQYPGRCGDWFMLAAEPWVHYIPVDSQFRGLDEVVRWAQVRLQGSGPSGWQRPSDC